MKILRLSLIIVAGAAVGLGVGWWLRSKNFGATRHHGAIEVRGRGATGNALVTPRKRVIPRADDSPLATHLERDLSLSSGVVHWLYWLEALERAAPGDFPRLYRLAKDNPTSARFVGARWAEVAPQHLFTTLINELKSGALPDWQLMNTLLSEWPKRDPDAAIAAFGSAPELGSHRRFDIAYALLNTDVERGLRLMADWDAADVGFGPSGEKAVAKWTAASPKHAAEFVLELPPGYSFRSAAEAVGKQWAQSDPSAALEFAASNPSELSSTLANSVLKQWGTQNPSEAAAWLSSAEPTVRNRLSPALVQEWAKKDAAGALSWCEENLTGSSLVRSVGGVVAGAAEKDIASAASLVVAMSPSAARAEAATAVCRKWLPGLSTGKAVPPEAMAWLGELDPISIRRVLMDHSWGWATSDTKTMADFVARRSSEEVPSHAYYVVARELARKNPADALEWAGRLPPAQAAAAGRTAFGEWRDAQPDAAMNWLNELSPTDSRREPFFEVVIERLAYHPQGGQQLSAMNLAERAAARRVLEGMTLAEDRRASLLSVLNNQ